jgi:hypothetical protein
MQTLTVSVDFQRAVKVVEDVRARALNLAPVMARVPSIVRTGPGGFATQIAARTFEDLQGGLHPWVEQSFTGGAFPPAAQEREQVLWNAALGGAGSITRYDGRSATIGVDDLQVREISASIGNGIVSEDPYFGPVTGNFGERTTPIIVHPSKPAVHNRRSAAITRRRRQERTLREDKAARIFIGLTYGVWFTIDRFAEGILLPPKPIGISAQTYAAARSAIASYIVGTVDWQKIDAGRA